MLIRQQDAFYIEHGGRRVGYFNSRMNIHDAGLRDRPTVAYKAEQSAEAKFSVANRVIDGPLKHYRVASIIDHIVTQEQYVEWFGGTHLLVMFNSNRSRSRAWHGCCEFTDHHASSLAWFDVYHELAHHITLRDDEPTHGERFMAAMLLIASLSPLTKHAVELARQCRTLGIFPHSKYFRSQFFAD